MSFDIQNFGALSIHPPHQRVFIPSPSSLDVHEIKDGILIAVSPWIFHTKCSFHYLSQSLSCRRSARGVTLYIADTENESLQNFIKENGDIPSASGETYWIKNGVVIGKVKACTEANADLIKTYTDQLLGEEGEA